MRAANGQANEESDRARETRWLGEVQKIVADRLRGHRADVYLFGSRARGDSRPTSDIDVAIDPRGPLSHVVISRLRDALEESTVPLRVDVVDLRDAGPALRERVFREGRRWIVSESA